MKKPFAKVNLLRYTAKLYLCQTQGHGTPTVSTDSAFNKNLGVGGNRFSPTVVNTFGFGMSCKLFYEVSEADNIYQRVSLDKFEIVPWQKNDKLSRFLKKCRESKNLEALYRKRVVDYFTDKHEDSALECLEEAANSGHADAAYALGIIYIFVGGDELKRKGILLLSGMKKSRILKGKVKLCRDNLRALLRMIWVKNPVFLNPTPICCAMT
nr:putative F-box protein At1g67623 [Coffea arabica]